MVAASVAALGFAKQTAQGTPTAAAKHRLALLGGNLAPNVQRSDLDETSSSAVNRLRASTVTNSVSSEGTPEFAMRMSWIADMLYLALGAVTTTGVAAPWEHEIVPAATIPYSTWYKMLGGIIFEQYRDCKVTQLVLTSESGQPVRVQATVLGLDPRSDSTDSQSAVVLDVDDPVMHYDGAGAFEVDGDVVSCLERIVLTINNNGEALYGDSLTGCKITEGLLDVTIEATHAIDNADTYNLFHYGSATPADESLPNPDPMELAGGIDFKWTAIDSSPGPEESLQVVAPRLQVLSLGGYEAATDPTAILRQTASYKVLLPVAGAGITATVLNGIATI